MSCPSSPVRKAREDAWDVTEHPARVPHPPALGHEQEGYRHVGENAGEAGQGVRDQDLGEVYVRCREEDARQGREKQRRVFPESMYVAGRARERERPTFSQYGTDFTTTNYFCIDMTSTCIEIDTRPTNKRRETSINT